MNFLQKQQAVLPKKSPEVVIKPKRKNKPSTTTTQPNNDEMSSSKQSTTTTKTDLNSNSKKLANTMDNAQFTFDDDELTSSSTKAHNVMISDMDNNSSESDKEVEVECGVKGKQHVEKHATEELPDERKGLFNEESFEEDLPYVPTTLPMEKSVALPILPIKQRLQEIR